jgi:type I restriction enzyme S subunit
VSWATLPLEDACDLITDGTHHSPTNGSEGAHKYVTAKNIRPWGLDLSDITYVTEAVHHEIFARCPVRKGDVLYIKDGVTTGLAVVNPLDEPFSVLSSVAVLRPKTGVLEPAFLRHWLNSPQTVAEMTGNMTGTAIKRLVLRQIRAARAPVPPLDEQRRIVAKLEALQARSRRAREALDAVPPLLEKLRQSILAAAFRGDLTKDWRAKHKDVEPASKLLERIRVERRKKWEEGELAKMKAKGKAPTDDKWKAKYREPAAVDATGLPELPEGWCWASVGELAHVGTGATPKRGEEKYYLGGNVSWVTSGALNDEEVTQATELVTDCAVAETNLTVYAPGTLLLAMYGEGKTRGMVAELRIDAATNQAIAAICLDGSAASTKSLVRLALERNYAEIRSLSMGGVQPNLNLEKVRGLAVPLCPPDEVCVLESAVRASLERASRVLDVVRAQGVSLQTLNRCLLATAFRGELVPQDPNDEPAEVMLARLRAADGAASNGVKATTSKRGRTRGSRESQDGEA